MATIRTPTFLGYENRAYYLATDGTMDGPHLWTDQELEDYHAGVSRPDDPDTLDPGKTWRLFAIEGQAEVWDTESTNLEPGDVGDRGDGKYSVILPDRADFSNEIVLDKAQYSIGNGGNETLTPSRSDISILNGQLTDLR